MNHQLVTLVKKWQEDGSPRQEGINWTPSKHNWQRAFPREEVFLSGLPSEIDRTTVRAICESAKYSIREKFLAVMVWGYGDRGYGPYRVTQMFAQAHAEGVLSEVYELCKVGNPKGAYEFLMNNRIKTLGPSYGSKFITFCVPREFGAPIYDSYIAMWVKAFAAEEFLGIPTSSESWNAKTYSRYWDWIKEHSGTLGCFPDDIELVLFRDAESKFSKSSGWSGK